MNLLDSVLKAGEITVEPTPLVLSSARRPRAPTPAQSAVTLPVEGAPAEGNAAPEEISRLIDSARTEAGRILRLAERDAEQILRTAQSQGFEAGRAEGRAKGEAETREALLAAGRALAESYRWRDEIISKSEATIIELVGDVAEKLFGSGHALPPEQVSEMVERAIQQARNLGAARVRLHPEDAALLNTMWPSGLPLVPDETIKRGGCIVEGAQGTVDGRIEVQLEKIKQTLASEVMGNGQ